MTTAKSADMSGCSGRRSGDPRTAIVALGSCPKRQQTDMVQEKRGRNHLTVVKMSSH